MRRTFRLPARLLVCAAALAGSASLAVVAVPGGTASATVLSVTCTKLTGTSTTQKLTGCSGTGKTLTGATGTTTVASNDKSATVRWATGKNSTEDFTYTTVHTNACPAVTGQSKFLEVTESGTVKSGTATGLNTGKVSGKVCIYKKSTGTKAVDLVNSLGSVVI